MKVRNLIARICTNSIPTWVSEAVQSFQIISGINIKACPSTEVVKSFIQSIKEFVKRIKNTYGFVQGTIAWPHLASYWLSQLVLCVSCWREHSEDETNCTLHPLSPSRETSRRGELGGRREVRGRPVVMLLLMWCSLALSGGMEA